MMIHPKWQQATPTNQSRTCEWCKRPFDHGNSRRMFCGEHDCDRERDRVRKQERAELRGMLAEAEAKRKARRDEIVRMEAEYVALVKQAFRETRQERRMVTEVEQRIKERGEEVSTYRICQYNDVVLGKFVGFEAGRSRGSWVEVANNGSVSITFCGRVGGGNREDYEETWDEASDHDWFTSAEEEESDTTYAYFTFAVPSDRVEQLWTLTPKPS